MAVEYVDEPESGRVFRSTRRVRLSDADARGRLRVDGLARYLQDAGSDDWDDAGLPGDDVWVARQCSIDSVGEWPRLGETVAMATWCGGTGAAWAERRTDVAVDGTVRLRAAALWVPVGPEGRPRRLRDEFFGVYGAAARGRRVPGRVAASAPGPAARRRPFALRVSDIDVVGHVNNTVAWQAVAEVAPMRVAAAQVTYHGSLEPGEPATLADDGAGVWLCVGDDVRVSGWVEGE
ncbi:MAG TPA: acyl-ACP thioesterase domain-containing protein [Acidimicrobiales bacterium]|nr:acyl-ACP thioesterase domain-containing protein [Acidimicrobiales bacterium]